MAVRTLALGLLVSLVSISPAFAQAARVGDGDGVFTQWESKDDFFAANFPGTPAVTAFTWETEYGAKIPARAYTATASAPQGTRKYVMTVVDYSRIRQIQEERAKSCDPRDERCGGTYPIEGVGYWKNELRGAMIYAATKYLQNDNYRLNHYMWNFLGGQGMEANELQLVSTRDKSLTHVTIYMHHNRLYVAEETTPANYPPPGLFVQSITLRESDGTNARHFGVYFNGPTIDPAEAKACTGGYIPNNGGTINTCKSLPVDVRFQQGPNFSIDDTAATQPRENRPAQ